MSASAWDITGAVVWSIVFMVCMGLDFATNWRVQAPNVVLLAFACTVGSLALAVFCDARLAGAHL